MSSILVIIICFNKTPSIRRNSKKLYSYSIWLNHRRGRGLLLAAHFPQFPNTELCLKFDTIYYYNMFDDRYFPNSPQRRWWRDHCF